jgi:hypothetical protein
MSTGPNNVQVNIGANNEGLRSILAQSQTVIAGWVARVIDTMQPLMQATGIAGFVSQHGAAVTAALGAAVTALTTFAGVAVIEAGNAERSIMRFQAVMKGVGQEVGYTTEQIFAMGDALQKSTEFSGESIRDAATELIKMNIGGTMFKRTLKDSADLAAFLGQNIDQAAQALGRAMQNPERSGYMLRGLISREDIAAIRKMAKEGDVTGAQERLLSSVEKRVGGLAEAFGNTWTGQMTQVREMLNDIAEDFGKVLLPIMKLIVPVLRAMVSAFGAVVDVVVSILDPLSQFVIGLLDLREALDKPLKFFGFEIGSGTANAGLAQMQERMGPAKRPSKDDIGAGDILFSFGAFLQDFMTLNWGFQNQFNRNYDRFTPRVDDESRTRREAQQAQQVQFAEQLKQMFKEGPNAPGSMTGKFEAIEATYKRIAEQAAGQSELDKSEAEKQTELLEDQLGATENQIGLLQNIDQNIAAWTKRPAFPMEDA